MLFTHSRSVMVHSGIVVLVIAPLLGCVQGEAAGGGSGNSAITAAGREVAEPAAEREVAEPAAEREVAEPTAGVQSSSISPPGPEEIALFDYDASAPLEVTERSRSPFNGVMRIDLTYASPRGGRVPAWVYEPTHDGPHAGLVFMHGMPSSRDQTPDLAASYARSGAVVIAISAPFARPDGPREDVVTFTEQDRDEQIQLIVDLRRAVDYLLAHPAVDPERIGYLGASYGGAMGGLLAGLEDRIAAYALVVGDGGLVAHFSGPEDQIRERLPAEEWEAWLAAMEPIEPTRFVGLATPTPLLFQNGRADRLVPAADAERYQQAASEPKTVLWYDTGHARTPEMIRDQVEWLAQHIGIDPDRFFSIR